MSLEDGLVLPPQPYLLPLIDGLPFSPVAAIGLGWLSCAIVLAALSSRLPWPRGCRDNPLLFLGLAILTLLPVGNHPGLAAGLHGTIGTPSGTLLQLAVLSFFNRPWPALPCKRGLWLIVLGILTFYALSLGAGRTWLPDPYAWGYQPQWLLLATLLAGLALYHHGQNGWLVILTVDLWLWALGIHASHNLWDVLFDPILLGIALWQAIRRYKPAAPVAEQSDQSSGRS